MKAPPTVSCLLPISACQEAESCVAVSLSEAESATRCIFYPDTTICGLSSAPSSSGPASSCKLVIKESAPQVYVRKGEAVAYSQQRTALSLTGRWFDSSPVCVLVSSELLPSVTTVSIEGHGILQGVAMETVLGSYRRTVVQFLGVPYARPPIGSFRFEDAQPADWTGTWDATKPR